MIESFVFLVIIVFAVYGFIWSIRNRRYASLLIGLIGVVGVVIFVHLMVSSLRAASAASLEGGFCGTSMIDSQLRSINYAAHTYGPWVIVSLIVACAGGWTALWSVFFCKSEKSPSNEVPDTPLEIPNNGE